MRKAVYRTAKSMPQERHKYADVITRMVEKSTPKTKKVLQERVIVSPSSKKKLDFMSTSFVNLKKHGQPEKEEEQRGSENKEDAGVFSWLKIKSKYLVQHSTKLGIGYKLLKRVQGVSSPSELDAQKRRKDAISDDLKQMIHSFFRCTDVLRSLADARSAK